MYAPLRAHGLGQSYGYGTGTGSDIEYAGSGCGFNETDQAVGTEREKARGGIIVAGGNIFEDLAYRLLVLLRIHC